MRFLIPAFFLLFTGSITAQTVFTSLGEDAASELANATGAFVVIDFYADWCGPCRTMDDKVWSRDTVQALQQRFVNRRIDASSTNAGLIKYSIKAIPALIIEDANGNEYFRRVGFMSKHDVIRVLNQFPSDMTLAYAADKAAASKPDDFKVHLQRAQHYQLVARDAEKGIAAQLAKISSDGLKDAMKLLSREEPKSAEFVERLNLMEAENLLLRGRAKKALKALAALGEDIDANNEARACYIKGMAYRKTGKPELADDCYDRLREAKDNEVFLALYTEATARTNNRYPPQPIPPRVVW